MLFAKHEASKSDVSKPVDEPSKSSKSDSLASLVPLAPVPGGKVVAPEPLRVCGYIVLGSRVNVILSDGRTLTELDPELKKIHRNAVFVGGEKLFMKQPKDKVLAPGAPPVVLPTAVNAAVVESLPPPPAAPASSWVTYSDGVSRLVAAPTLAK